MMDELRQIRESQIRMESDLKYHIKRTDLLEAEVKDIDERVIEMSKPIPFKEIVKISGTVAALVSSILMILKYFKGI